MIVIKDEIARTLANKDYNKNETLNFLLHLLQNKIDTITANTIDNVKHPMNMSIAFKVKRKNNFLINVSQDIVKAIAKDIEEFLVDFDKNSKDDLIAYLDMCVESFLSSDTQGEHTIEENFFISDMNNLMQFNFIGWRYNFSQENIMGANNIYCYLLVLSYVDPKAVSKDKLIYEVYDKINYMPNKNTLEENRLSNYIQSLQDVLKRR